MGATPMLIPPPESQDALAKGIAEGATFPHEAGFAYKLASVVPYAIEPPLASATFATVMNPAKLQLAAAGSARHSRQGVGREGRDGVRQGLAGLRGLRAQSRVIKRG